VVGGGTPLFSSSNLSSQSGSLAGGTTVRVENLAGDTQAPSAAYVRDIDGSPAGWVAATGVAPQDSVGPDLWGVDGPKTISPNDDGVNDGLALTVRFSEAVAWRISLRAGWNVVWQAQGSGNQASIAWDAKVGGVAIANGEYALVIHAADEWGNDELDTNVMIVVDRSVMPVRQGGADRYATAATISAWTYAPGVPVVYIASGKGFADALAGAPAAGTAGGPLLLVPNTSIPAVVAAELDRLDPARIIVLGGPASVSDAVLLQLKAFTGS
jgi:hypothetical protein